MSDIFREIDEELRQERFQQLWKRYGTYVIAGIVALVLAIGGYKFYASYQLTRAGESGAQFAQATKLISEGKYGQAEPILSALAVGIIIAAFGIFYFVVFKKIPGASIIGFIFAGGALAGLAALAAVLYQRIKEIKRGEEDDLGKY